MATKKAAAAAAKPKPKEKPKTRKDLVKYLQELNMQLRKGGGHIIVGPKA